MLYDIFMIFKSGGTVLGSILIGSDGIRTP